MTQAKLLLYLQKFCCLGRMGGNGFFPSILQQDPSVLGCPPRQLCPRNILAAFLPLTSCLVHWVYRGKKETLPETEAPLLPPTEAIHLLSGCDPRSIPEGLPVLSELQPAARRDPELRKPSQRFGSPCTVTPPPDEFLWQVPGRETRSAAAVSVVSGTERRAQPAPRASPGCRGARRDPRTRGRGGQEGPRYRECNGCYV